MSRAETAVALRQALACAARSGPGRAYPRELRDRVVVFGQRRRAGGVSDEQVAREIGIPAMTLRRWVAAQPSAFAEVGVVQEPTARELVVHGPKGLRVEGMDLEQLVALWARLS